jgi:D-alanyl-D-alanine carboxypeptidase (penicillin-binding protein 5/6)
MRFLLVSFILFCSFTSFADDRSASLVIDVESEKILHSHNADEPRYPASLTKIMTIYLAFEALEAGVFQPKDIITVSRNAASQPRTNMNLRPGDKITVKDAIMGMIVHSANDAAVAIAEEISGSEEKFASLMTRKAKELGMYSTTFKNASGLPHEDQKTTAYEMAKLAISLKNDFPRYYQLFSVTEYQFKGQKLVSHNRVVKNYENIDGLKTGYTHASGFNLVSSASDRSQSVVGVVMGGTTARERDDKMVRLLNKFVDIKQNMLTTMKTRKKRAGNKKTKLLRGNRSA